MRPHFLRPLLAATPPPLVLRNDRTGRLLASAIEPAFDSATRRRGLLGRDTLLPGFALIIAPCQAVHTFRMHLAIDIVFADREGRVVKLREAVAPNRLAGSLAAFAVIELPTGAIREADMRVGDRLLLVTP